MEHQEIDDMPKKTYGMELLILLMIAVMVFIYFSSRFFIIIPPGHKGVLYRTFQGGTQLNDVYYNEGFHLIFPFNKMYLYNTRIQEHSNNIKALSEDGLEVKAHISYRYFPDYRTLGLLHKEIGPDYVKSILEPHITAITRNVVSHYKVDKLYSTSRDSIQIDMTQRSKKEINDHFPVTVIDVVIRDITLHEKVTQAIAQKLVTEQEMLEYDFKLAIEQKEADRRAIEAIGIKKFQDTSQVNILQWEGISATRDLAKSPNSKVVIIGTDNGELPVILGGSN